jgi:hypothetical protein
MIGTDLAAENFETQTRTTTPAAKDSADAQHTLVHCFH